MTDALVAGRKLLKEAGQIAPDSALQLQFQCPPLDKPYCALFFMMVMPSVKKDKLLENLWVLANLLYIYVCLYIFTYIYILFSDFKILQVSEIY